MLPAGRPDMDFGKQQPAQMALIVGVQAERKAGRKAGSEGVTLRLAGAVGYQR